MAINCIIAGDSQVGKTKFLALFGDRFKLQTTKGVYWFECKIVRSATEIPQACDCAIIMFDCTNVDSYKSVPKWHADIKAKHPDIPIVLLGSKSDLIYGKRKPGQMRARDITIHRYLGVKAWMVSGVSSYNLDKPWVYFLEQLAGAHLVELGESRL